MTSSDASVASLASLWASRLNAQETSMSYTSFRDLMRDLKCLGYQMPGERTITRELKHPQRPRFEFKDLLRLLWDALASWMTSNTSSETSSIPEALQKNLGALELELDGLVTSCFEDLTIEE